MSGGLRAELKQTKPFGTLEEEVALNIARTFAILDHEFTQALKPYDITPTQYNVLRILRGAGDAGLCRNEVGARLIRKVPDVTRLLDRMEEAGLIVRERESEDRRFVSTRISDGGLEVLTKLDTEICAIHRGQLGHLDEASLKTLIALLTKIRDK